MAKEIKKNPHKTNLDKVREKMANMGGDNRWWKPKQGVNIIRILPPWGEAAEGMFYLEGGLHYGFKIGGRDRALSCPEISGKGKCPICKFVDKLRESGKSDESGDGQPLHRRIGVRRKYWVNLIDRKDPETVLMYGMSGKQLQPLRDAFDDPDMGDITDPETGHDVKITREGTGMYGTRYTIHVMSKAKEIGIEGWEDKLFSLDTEVLEWMSYAEMVKHLKANYGEEVAEVGLKFDSTKSEDSEEEPEEKPKKKKKPIVEEEEDEKEDEDDDEEEKEKDDDEDDEDEEE